MKKLILIVAILSCFTSSNGQDTKPTKQETMEWIINKFKLYTNSDDQNNSYVTYHYSFVKADDKNITLLRTSQDADGKKWTTEVLIDLAKLTNISTIPASEKLVESLLMSGLDGFVNEGGRKSSSIYLYRKYNSENDNLILSMIRFDGEPDLYNRFIKALSALAEMNRQSGSNEKY